MGRNQVIILCYGTYVCVPLYLLSVGDYDKKEAMEDESNHTENHREKDIDSLVVSILIL